MRNKILHALSNRQGPFKLWSFGGRNSNFVPHSFSEELQRLRLKMRLDDDSTDYYLRCLIANLIAYPDIAASLDDRQCSYNPRTLTHPRTVISGADFLSSGSSLDDIVTEVPTTLPVPLTFSLRYRDAGHVSLHVKETGVKRTLKAVKVSNKLSVQWEPDAQFSTFVLQQEWNEASEITIYSEPASFPYSAWLAEFSGDQAFHRLLVRYEMVDEFVGNQDHTEKCALACAVMALQNRSIYG